MIQKNWVLILDFDSTLISIESLDFLSVICLKGKKNSNSIITKIKNLTSFGMKRKIAFQDSLKTRLRFLEIEDYHLNQLGMELKFFGSFSIRKNQLWLKKIETEFLYFQVVLKE